MNPNEIRAELIRKGIALADIARMCSCSRQMVWLAVRGGNGKGKSVIIRKKISELIGLKLD